MSKLGSIRPEKAGKASQKLLVIDVLTNESKEFESMAAAARYLNISQSAISNYLRLNQKKPYLKRYFLKRLYKFKLFTIFYFSSPLSEGPCPLGSGTSFGGKDIALKKRYYIETR